jgi:hypothetical protein
VGPDAASFAALVFSMHDVGELTDLMRAAGFRDVHVEAKPKTLRLPAPADFLWQYLYSTPVAGAVARIGEAGRDALERDVCEQWQRFVVDGAMVLQVGITTATGLK